ncbi:MAG TPA: hypothetical protein VHB79_23775 [Polyangiaceae bacterium]|nr:hypothetical protein [Polyangiaceae bacterium]
MTDPSGLTVLSSRQPFVTLHASGLDGPKTRQRVICRDQETPPWLAAYARYVEPGQVLLAVAMGRARLGATTRIRSIVTFKPQRGREPFTCVYVEEDAREGTAARVAAPVHIVRCDALPRQVRFVEVASETPSSPRHLYLT